MGLDLFFSGCFLMGLFYCGLRLNKKICSESQYLMAEKKTPLLALTATLVMTEFNTATLISFASLGYLAGAWALWLPTVFLIGLFFYAFAVAKKWKNFDGISVASFFTERYGKDIGMLANGALVVAMVGFSATYLKSLYLIFNPLFPSVNQWAFTAILTGAILLLTFKGGLISIIRTDLYSFFAVMIFFPILCYFAYITPIGPPIDIARGEAILPPKFICSLIILTMFTYILAPWYGQKIFSARDEKTAYLSVLFAAGFVFILYGFAVASTWFFHKNGGVVSNGEQALPYLMKAVLPKGLKGLGYAILFSASATTLTGVWSALSSVVIGDYFKIDGKESPIRSMTLMGIFALSSYILANCVVDRVFDKLILANIPIAALSFALLAGFYWAKASRFGAYLSIIAGWISGVGFYLYFGEKGGYTWYWAVWGILAIFIFGILGSILIPNKNFLKGNY